MASIIKKKKKGHTYYYAAESQRINGKPRIVWQKYLGTIDAIIGRTEKAKPSKAKEAVIFEAGGVAALLGITHRLGLIELINRIIPKRDQGPSVGHYLVLAALNRALAPCSKLAIGDWYEQTVLRRLWKYPKKAFSSQRFWDHMDLVSPEDIALLEERLIPRIRGQFGLDTDLLLYDTTNFFTFLATTNDRAGLPQRGYSKAKRHDLRQIGLALLVTRDFQIPLFHYTYPGNVPDVTLFPQISRQLLGRYHQIAGTEGEATVVLDKGNISDWGMEELVVSNTHFVAALSANRCPEFLAIPPEKFIPLSGLPDTRAFTTSADMWAKTCRVVTVYSESFFTQQLAGVTQNLTKCQKRLQELERSLSQWRDGKGRGKRPTVLQVKGKVRSILSAQFMKELFQIKVTSKKGLPCLEYGLDHAALQRLSQQRLGRTVLVSDRLDWSARQVIEAYRSLSQVEDVFRDMKNIDFLHWQPAYHWTDQKLRVHACYCVLALLLSTLAHKVTVQAGINLSLLAMLRQLVGIREVAVIYPQGTLAHPKDHITMSRMSPIQRKLARALNIADILGG